jgi:branched-chain amino acid transport system ATP-binding protein
MSVKMLELSDVNSYYGKSHILFDISLEVGKGEVVVLLGRNGVGKTTTLRTIMGLVSRRTGRIFFREEVDLIDLPPYRIAKHGVGYVPDYGGVFPNLTVEENLKISIKQSVRQSDRIFDMEEIFKIFPQLKEFAKRAAGTLSGGERRMLGIARGLLLNPDLLLIDEPSEGLAPKIVHDIAEIIKTIQEYGVSLLVADQNLPFVEKIADRVYVMDKGEIKLSGKMDELSRQDLERFLAFS